MIPSPAHESLRIDKNMYKVMTPIRRRTFSETMIKRRRPFIHSENSEMDPATPLRQTKITKGSYGKHLNFSPAKKHETLTNKENFKPNIQYETCKFKQNHPKQEKLLVTNIIMEGSIAKTETLKQVSQGWFKTTTQIFDNDDKATTHEPKPKAPSMNNETLKYNEISHTSDYYSDPSITENLITTLDSIKKESSKNQNYSVNYSLDENIKPVTNSTFIGLEEMSENETNMPEIVVSAKEIKDENISITGETNKFTINRSEMEIIEIKANKPHTTNEAESNVFKNQKQNFSIPSIVLVVNENKERGNSFESDETPTKTQYKENKELLPKLNEMQLSNQIDIKDKVMAQLLELAASKGFPELKHCCNAECMKTEESSCKKAKIKNEDKVNQNVETTGFFTTIWSIIKYPFSNSDKTATVDKDVEKEDKEQHFDGEKGNEKKNVMEHKEMVKENETNIEIIMDSTNINAVEEKEESNNHNKINLKNLENSKDTNIKEDIEEKKENLNEVEANNLNQYENFKQDTNESKHSIEKDKNENKKLKEEKNNDKRKKFNSKSYKKFPFVLQRKIKSNINKIKSRKTTVNQNEDSISIESMEEQWEVLNTIENELKTLKYDQFSKEALKK